MLCGSECVRVKSERRKGVGEGKTISGRRRGAGGAIYTRYLKKGHQMRNPPMFVRRPFWWQVLLQGVLPVVITLLLGWAANKVHEMDVKLSTVVYTIEDIDRKLTEHQEVTREVLKKTADLHHNTRMSFPCTGCHKP